MWIFEIDKSPDNLVTKHDLGSRSYLTIRPKLQLDQVKPTDLKSLPHIRNQPNETWGVMSKTKAQGGTYLEFT